MVDLKNYHPTKNILIDVILLNVYQVQVEPNKNKYTWMHAM